MAARKAAETERSSETDATRIAPEGGEPEASEVTLNKQIRRLAVGLFACYVALFVQLNVVQVIRADELNNRPGNTRAVLRDFNQPRGTVQSADGVLLAQSVPSEGQFELQRTFPEGALYGHITGYFSFVYGAEGVERSYNDELSGETAQQQFRSLSDLFVERDRTGNLTLTVRDDVQRAARGALGDRRGSVVVLGPRDGAVLGLWSNPSYDPNRLSTHDQEAAEAAREALLDDPANPLQPKTYRETYFPGSTFKVVTAAAGLRSGEVTAEAPVYEASSGYTAPQTSRPLRNFGGSTCGGALFEILADSCNTAFAEMGTETLGPEIMIDAAEAFGFNAEPPLDLPAVIESPFRTDYEQNLPILAQTSIGQNGVRSTPLQLALIAAAVANEGEIMAPHVLDEIRDGDGEVLDTYDPDAWRTPLDTDDAETLRRAMIGVVLGGTATRLVMDGLEVGGKTGTAQVGQPDGSVADAALIIRFAGPPGEAPEVAVAVVVEAGGADEEQTGGRVAAPIAQQVIQAALQPPADDAEPVPPPDQGGGWAASARAARP